MKKGPSENKDLNTRFEAEGKKQSIIISVFLGVTYGLRDDTVRDNDSCSTNTILASKRKVKKRGYSMHNNPVRT